MVSACTDATVKAANNPETHKNLKSLDILNLFPSPDWATRQRCGRRLLLEQKISREPNIASRRRKVSRDCICPRPKRHQPAETMAQQADRDEDQLASSRRSNTYVGIHPRQMNG